MRTEWTWRHNQFISAGSATTDRGVAERNAEQCRAAGNTNVDVVCRQVTDWAPADVRPTATITDTTGTPIDRDEYAASLETHTLDRPGHRDVKLTEGEIETIAALLDELAGVYPDEALGVLARRLAVRLYDRAGI